MTIIVAEANAARFRTALTLALTTRALGGRARLFLDAAAVGLLAGEPDEATSLAAGLPAQAALIADAADAGVELILCQTGLALHGIAAVDLAPCWQVGGMVSVMAEPGDDHLLIA